MAVLIKTGNHQFRFRTARTGDMPLETIDIFNKLGLTVAVRPCRKPRDQTGITRQPCSP